jgi:hypothetical protein
VDSGKEDISICIRKLISFEYLFNLNRMEMSNIITM